jgi:HK97 family phage portal protein
MALAAQQYGAAFFGNGAALGGLLSFDQVISEPAMENLREAIRRRHQSVENAHRLFLMPPGAKFQAIGEPPKNTQLLELRQFEVREVARYFGIPPEKIWESSGDSTTYASVEARGIQYAQSLLPRLVNFESELHLKLVAASERRQQFFRHNLDGLLRADSAGRAAFLTSMVNSGVMSPNECRGKLDLPPVEGGDALRAPLNTAPLAQSQPQSQTGA